ncbi:3-hydroxybutyrate dehydrogenase [Dongia sp.]|uniref:3-hydroxybutyrate dehydrogenase n=1 Tax=Dongia sp. TaxID=1977262 RepID=UPI0035B184A5
MNTITPEGAGHRADASLVANRALSGRVAIVTGSTSGIGLAILQELAGAGAHVVMNGFGDTKELTATAQRLSASHQVEIAFHGADMSRPAEIVDLVSTTEMRFGRVDILVNNAGIQHVASIDEFPAEKWDAILAINLSSAFHATQSVLPGMKSRRFGRIINIASAHGLVGSPYKVAYVAAKHGVLGLTKVTALETAELGITANAICPGYVWTPLVEKQITAQAMSHNIDRTEVIRNVLLAQQPNKQFAEASEIGALAVFLAGDAARSITGASLSVDGGWTAH